MGLCHFCLPRASPPGLGSFRAPEQFFPSKKKIKNKAATKCQRTEHRRESLPEPESSGWAHPGHPRHLAPARVGAPQAITPSPFPPPPRQKKKNTFQALKPTSSPIHPSPEPRPSAGDTGGQQQPQRGRSPPQHCRCSAVFFPLACFFIRLSL